MQLEAVLVPVNIAVYVSIAVGVIQTRRRRTAKKLAGSNTAFGLLESAMMKRFPDLPEGFTLREGLRRARSIEPDLGWDKIERSLDGYEAYRYGDDPPPSNEQPELGKLIRKLGSGW